MTESELDAIEECAGPWAAWPAARQLIAALRAAWAELDGARADEKVVESALADSREETKEMRAERDARPDAATVAKVREALEYAIEWLNPKHLPTCAQVKDQTLEPWKKAACDCGVPDYETVREALRLLEKP